MNVCLAELSTRICLCEGEFITGTYVDVITPAPGAGVGEEDDGIKGQPLNYHPATHQLSCGNLQASFGCHNKSSRHPLELTVDSKANPAS